MPSLKPADWGSKGVGAPIVYASPAQRESYALGTFTANTTKTTIAIPFDRPAVLREIWFAADAVPSDADGTMLINAKVQDITEGAADSIVASFDTEAVILAAKKAYRATFVAETSENEYTVEAGDVLFFEQVNNSAAIDTNANITVLVVLQYIVPVES